MSGNSRALVLAVAADPAIAATTRVPHPYPQDEAVRFVEQQRADRAAGTAFVFAIEAEQQLVGVVGLHDIEGGEARELGYWIGKPYQGRGHATFGVGLALEFTFQNLRLDRVRAVVIASNAASVRVLRKHAFCEVDDPRREEYRQQHGGAEVLTFALQQQEWWAARNGPVLARLHPALRALLDAELAAGNEVKETGQGSPDRDSVFVRLRDAFRARPAQLPAGVTYSEPNDRYWWLADYSTNSPRHVLAC